MADMADLIAERCCTHEVVFVQQGTEPRTEGNRDVIPVQHVWTDGRKQLRRDPTNDVVTVTDT
jgi:hypothetical protein